jgi:hypothetical protein
MSDERARMSDEAAALVDQIMPLLAGRDPDVQGAALLLLLDIWLGGHFVKGGDAADHRLLRTHLLGQHFLAAVNMLRADDDRQTH